MEKEKLIVELHCPALQNFKRRRIVVTEIDDLWQADLVDMKAYSKFNCGHHYILPHYILAHTLFSCKYINNKKILFFI